MSLEPIQIRCELAAAPAESFDTSTGRLGAFWPLAYTFSDAEGA